MHYAATPKDPNKAERIPWSHCEVCSTLIVFVGGRWWHLAD